MDRSLAGLDWSGLLGVSAAVAAGKSFFLEPATYYYTGRAHNFSEKLEKSGGQVKEAKILLAITLNIMLCNNVVECRAKGEEKKRGDQTKLESREIEPSNCIVRSPGNPYYVYVCLPE